MTTIFVLETGCKYEGGSAIGIFDYETGKKKAFELAESIKKQGEGIQVFDDRDLIIDVITDTDNELLLNICYDYVSLTRYCLNDSTEVDKKISRNIANEEADDEC